MAACLGTPLDQLLSRNRNGRWRPPIAKWTCTTSIQRTCTHDYSVGGGAKQALSSRLEMVGNLPSPATFALLSPAQLWGNKLAGTLPDAITTLTQLSCVLRAPSPSSSSLCGCSLCLSRQRIVSQVLLSRGSNFVVLALRRPLFSPMCGTSGTSACTTMRSVAHSPVASAPCPISCGWYSFSHKPSAAHPLHFAVLAYWTVSVSVPALLPLCLCPLLANNGQLRVSTVHSSFTRPLPFLRLAPSHLVFPFTFPPPPPPPSVHPLPPPFLQGSGPVRMLLLRDPARVHVRLKPDVVRAGSQTTLQPSPCVHPSHCM